MHSFFTDEVLFVGGIPLEFSSRSPIGGSKHDTLAPTYFLSSPLHLTKVRTVPDLMLVESTLFFHWRHKPQFVRPVSSAGEPEPVGGIPMEFSSRSPIGGSKGMTRSHLQCARRPAGAHLSSEGGFQHCCWRAPLYRAGRSTWYLVRAGQSVSSDCPPVSRGWLVLV
jgi:hypothetical protein